MKNALIKSTTVCALALWGATFLIPVCARAAVISLDTFDGSSANLLNGTTPSTTLGAFGGTAGTTWGTVSGSPPSMSLNTSEYEANGSVTAQPFFLNDASLPFSPQANMIYTLSADMNATAGGSSWFSVSLLIANYGVATRILQRNTRGAGQGDVGSGCAQALDTLSR